MSQWLTDRDRIQAAISSLPPQGRRELRATQREVAQKLGAPQGVLAFLAWQAFNMAFWALIQKMVANWWTSQSPGRMPAVDH